MVTHIMEHPVYYLVTWSLKLFKLPTISWNTNSY